MAVGDALAGADYDEILLFTLPVGLSRWLQQDLPHRLGRTFGLPVTHVLAGSRRRIAAGKDTGGGDG